MKSVLKKTKLKYNNKVIIKDKNISRFCFGKRKLIKYGLFRYKLQIKEKGYISLAGYNSIQLNHKEKIDLIKTFYYKLWLRKFFQFYLREKKLTKLQKILTSFLKRSKGGSFPLQIDFLEKFESQLYMILFRSGFVMSRGVSVRYIKSGFILVNNQKVLNPYYSVKEGDIISLQLCPFSFSNIKKRGIKFLLSRLVNRYYLPSYLEVCYQTLSICKVSPVDMDLDLPYLYKKNLPFDWFIRDFNN